MMKMKTMVALGLLGAPASVTRAAPTFNKDIAPIVWNNCAGCHHAGEVAPFNLTSYQDVKSARSRSRRSHIRALCRLGRLKKGMAILKAARRCDGCADHANRQWGRMVRPRVMRRICRHCPSSPKAGNWVSRTSW